MENTKFFSKVTAIRPVVFMIKNTCKSDIWRKNCTRLSWKSVKSNFLEKKLKFYENVDLIANFVNVNLPLITIFLNIIVA